MTREEAIRWLEDIHRRFNPTGENLENEGGDVHLQALDMAIETLQREEAEAKGYCHRIKPKEYLKNDAIKPSNDVISRADAITEFREWVKRANENGETPTWNDAVSLIGSLPSAEQVISKLNNPCDSLLTDESNGSKEHKSKLDLISRQDVIEALCRSSVYAWSIEQDQTAHNWALNIIKALPSVDAMPTVIRSRTLLPTKDFKEWVKRIKEVNPNAIVIPCDAEVASAEAEQGVWEHIESMWEDNIFKCSKCGNPLIIPTVDGEPIYNYCLHCGAKMGNAWGERIEATGTCEGWEPNG